MTGRLQRKEIIQTEYRKLMLRAAENVIIRRGFRSATMDEIAREAGFSKATLYKYFRNKAQIFLGIILQYIEEIKDRLQAIQASDLAPEDKLQEMILAVMEIQNSKENISRLLLQDPNLREFAHQLFAPARKDNSREVQQALKIFDARREEIRQSGYRVIVEGIDQGKFKEADPEILLHYVWALLEGLMHTRFWQKEKVSPQEEARRAFEFLVRGIGREPLQKGVKS
ncbi:MAG: TetR/AcrR family transcriptional regulator [Candidatus Saccharicenans sp.]|uniref:TetR/AcrR family transcriptional regulator n=1 Tax=Candidatus Saccharicenans sp. TaxID=2819258 RepID=UPI00404B7A1A